MTDRSKRVELPSKEVLTQVFRYEHEKGEIWWKEPGFNRKMNRPCGYPSSGGYMVVRVFGGLYAIHRIIWKLFNQTEPQHLDHINGVRTDNRIANLRMVDRKENNRNISITKANTSGYIGVRFDARYGKWTAQIKIERKAVSLGSFDLKQEAVKAYNDAALELHGEFAYRKISYNKKMLFEEFGESI